MIIQIAFRGIGSVFFREYGVNQFFGGCFTIASRDGNKRNGELVAVMSGQRLQCRQGIINPDKAVISRCGFFIYHGEGCPIFQGLHREQITVKMVSLQCKKKIAGLNLPGIGANGGMFQIKPIEGLD